MEISINKSAWGTTMVIEADNVKIEESVSSAYYGETPDGKKDFNNRLGVDIEDEPIEKLASVLDSLVYYREREIDLQSLVETILEKSPYDIREIIYESLKEEFGES